MQIDFLKSALQNTNIQAFLAMIRKSEGTASGDGYSYIFGSSPSNTTRFHDFSKHPNIKVPFRDTFSTAAGAYQILYGTWEQIQAKLNLPDFSPQSQDIACVELLSQRNCVQRLMDGDFNYALQQAASIWASLPGAGYNQPEHSIAVVTEWYNQAGGTIA